MNEQEIERRFRVAVKHIQNKEIELPIKPSTSQQLFFYGRYKQATIGDCQGEQPSMWNPVKRYMWGAHAKNRGKPKLQAMKEYVDEINKLVADFDLASLTPDLRARADDFLHELAGTGPYAPKKEPAPSPAPSAVSTDGHAHLNGNGNDNTNTSQPNGKQHTHTYAEAAATPPSKSNGTPVEGAGPAPTRKASSATDKDKLQKEKEKEKPNNNNHNTVPITSTSTSTSTSSPVLANGQLSKRQKKRKASHPPSQSTQSTQSNGPRYQVKTTPTQSTTSPAGKPIPLPTGSTSPAASPSLPPTNDTSTSASTAAATPAATPSSTSDTSILTDPSSLSARLLALQKENHSKLLQLEAHILNVTKKAAQSKVISGDPNDTVQQLESKHQQDESSFSQAEQSWKHQLARIEQVQASLMDRVSNLHPRTISHVEQTYAQLPTRTRHGVEPAAPVPLPTAIPITSTARRDQSNSFTPSETTQTVLAVVAAVSSVAAVGYVGWRTWQYIQQKRRQT